MTPNPPLSRDPSMPQPLAAMSRRAFVAVVLAGLVAGSGCKRSSPAKENPVETRPPEESQLVVFAAASLRDVFAALGETFELAHPGVDLTFNFAGTQELRAQLEHGAAADVLAAADLKSVRELAAADRVVAPVVFARNEPVLVVATEAATTIRAFADLSAASRIVVGSPEVPIGRYTAQILDRAAASRGADFRAHVDANIVSREPNVRQVLAKVTLGEAQVGIVYRTDARAARGAARVVEIPPELNVIAEYPIAVVRGAAHPRLAQAWVALVTSAEGRRALQDAGFLAPSGAPTSAAPSSGAPLPEAPPSAAPPSGNPPSGAPSSAAPSSAAPPSGIPPSVPAQPGAPESGHSLSGHPPHGAPPSAAPPSGPAQPALESGATPTP